MSDPDRLSSHDKAFDRDTPGLYPTIVCCFSCCALLAYGDRCWNAVMVDGACKRRHQRSDKTSSISEAACG